MGQKDPRVDAYIAKAAPFAQPILSHIRAVVHAACPQVQETIKWSMPHFEHGGGILCHMAAFKEHCAIGFWKGSLILGPQDGERDGMGHFGRIRSLKDLPADAVLKRWVKKAAQLNLEGVKVPGRARKPAAPAPVPADLKSALAKDRQARANFDALSPSHRREYVEWIAEAKTDATRQKRLATTVQWLAEGKSRNWKYERK